MTLDGDMIRKIFEEEIPFLQKVKVLVEEVSPRHARLRLPHTKDNENYWGTSHAGALFTFGETCGGVLVAASFPLADIILLAKGASINYRKGVRGDITCEISISEEEVKKIMDETEMRGSCIYPISMEFKNDEGETAAEMIVDYYFRKRK